MHVVDKSIIDIIKSSGIDIIMSLPCNMLSGIIRALNGTSIAHIPVCREEEGIGIAAGAALAGKRPMILMQNSGLGNSINAIMSLTSLYRLPIFIIMSQRGGTGEKISAQIPMGSAAPDLLKALHIEFITLRQISELAKLHLYINKTFADSLIGAAFLSRELWHEKM